jgi:hypothetical protein
MRGNPEANEAFGRQLLNAYYGRAGSVPKALAYYNAGPGRTQQAIRKYGDNWLAHMPKETQDYVWKIFGKHQLGGTAPDFARPGFSQTARSGSSVDPIAGLLARSATGQPVGLTGNNSDGIAGLLSRGSGGSPTSWTDMMWGGLLVPK